MLGANIDSTPWPQCGEIDILEQRGQEPTIAVGSLHGPGYSGGAAISARHRLEGGGSFSDDFHRFAVEWDPTRIAFFVDDTLYQIVTADEVLARGAWVYDHPFFLILNLAVGGNFVGPPDAQTPFPAQLKVAWVHVSQRTP
jgi:beta-glucanase (GH16 family)